MKHEDKHLSNDNDEPSLNNASGDVEDVNLDLLASDIRSMDAAVRSYVDLNSDVSERW